VGELFDGRDFILFVSTEPGIPEAPNKYLINEENDSHFGSHPTNLGKRAFKTSSQSLHI
jgi:hypothetical protein